MLYIVTWNSETNLNIVSSLNLNIISNKNDNHKHKHAQGVIICIIMNMIYNVWEFDFIPI